MDYQEFLDYIKENIAEYFEGQEQYHDVRQEEEKTGDTKKEKRKDHEVDIRKVIKNNGIVLDGLTFRKKGENVSPNIYLNPYFESYQMGKPLTVIMEEIACRYYKLKEEMDLETPDLLDFQAVKNQITVRLINYEKNKELLSECPHKRYLDLAVTFRYIASRNSLGIASSLVSNQEYDVWNIGLEELYQIALFNTMREFPWQMDSLAKVLSQCLKNRIPDGLSKEMIAQMEEIGEMEHGVNLYVLTNDTGINGATCILYDNVIRNFAKVQDCNVFVLPSSVHEVMLVPENAETDPEFLAALVRDANQSAVGLIDLLSDHIYYYDREKNEMVLYMV